MLSFIFIYLLFQHWTAAALSKIEVAISDGCTVDYVTSKTVGHLKCMHTSTNAKKYNVYGNSTNCNIEAQEFDLTNAGVY